MFMARRKRLRNNPRDEWEFDLLEEDEAEGLNGAGKMGIGGKRGGKRRAGELYDAFAAGSEEELSEGEFSDGEGSGSALGGKREKRYEDQHVVGSDDESGDEDGVEAGDEKRTQGEKLLHK